MNNIMNNRVNFCAKFSLSKSELSKISVIQKAKFLKQKDAIIDEFCKKGTSFSKVGENYIVDVKDEKEELFLNFAKKLGLEFKKIFGEN